MSSTQRNDIRPVRRQFLPQKPPASRRGREFWIVRWIGAGKQRTSTLAADVAVEAPSAQIIQLNWADTFGRSPHAEPAGVLRPAGTVVRLMSL